MSNAKEEKLIVARSYLAEQQKKRDSAYAEYLDRDKIVKGWLDEIERIEKEES